jgi:hypothetical protein
MAHGKDLESPNTIVQTMVEASPTIKIGRLPNLSAAIPQTYAEQRVATEYELPIYPAY